MRRHHRLDLAEELGEVGHLPAELLAELVQLLAEVAHAAHPTGPAGAAHLAEELLEGRALERVGLLALGLVAGLVSGAVVGAVVAGAHALHGTPSGQLATLPG